MKRPVVRHYTSWCLLGYKSNDILPALKFLQVQFCRDIIFKIKVGLWPELDGYFLTYSIRQQPPMGYVYHSCLRSNFNLHSWKTAAVFIVIPTFLYNYSWEKQAEANNSACQLKKTLKSWKVTKWLAWWMLDTDEMGKYPRKNLTNDEIEERSLQSYCQGNLK